MATLKNGATLIYEELLPSGESKVLARSENDFITWLKDNEGNCFWGHYFPMNINGLHEAIQDFNTRS